MQLPTEMLPAEFIARPNRFLVVAKLKRDGTNARAHCADPGRMRELLKAGTTVYLSKASNPKRKTAYDLRLVVHPENGELVSVVSHLANRLFADAFASGSVPPLSDYRLVRNEVSVPEAVVKTGQTRSRFDFLLEDVAGDQVWTEVKSVTLVRDRVAYFPDAITARGRRHVHELVELREKLGVRTAVVFIVQRADADEVRPDRGIDPEFADAMWYAVSNGVETYAYGCVVELESIRIDRRIPVVVSASD